MISLVGDEFMMSKTVDKEAFSTEPPLEVSETRKNLRRDGGRKRGR